MNRTLRWVVAGVLAAALLLVAVVALPFADWLPGGTVADVPTSQVVNGSAFNQLFPEPETGEQLVFTQEKRGFAQARLRQGDELRALLSISDVITAPDARAKFSASRAVIKGWPLVEQGSQASALLVADRFQVKVIGQGVGMDPQQRHAVLEAFDLTGLAALKPALTGAVPLRLLLARAEVSA
ncbi:hypothetical protein [Synechococcus sp. CBW1006]|uniref:hypothetical protein n=1 Tax=Synechococcus sp. CBW1006 TaxID=1353138 RepID=UPI0018CE7A92|nr:hypothetical protein [Synechococcus sp. CBW1006]QPN65737.1 hypothetical protein H8F26_12585 [Synechococcus sp. CBW1006]